MSTSVELLRGPREAWAPPAAQPLDEAVWQAWIAKGRAQDRRNSIARMKTVKWVSIAGLLAAAGLWSHPGPYDFVVRSIVAAGAMIVLFQALHARHYAVVAVSGALALLYNPLAPAFSFSGGWQSAVVVASVVPFAASLVGAPGTEQRLVTGSSARTGA